MSAALTPWFPARVKPVHAGVYELSDLLFPFHYWDGSAWLFMAESAPSKFMDSEITHALSSTVRLTIGYVTTTKWRGLAADPQAVKP